ncbi:hypothetical protein J3B02_003788 [Coemansia erecta]|uniref:Uncharacterized protein n=1 Tax=Coemansia asiatica TaxID=1052880 RepID=A0A9W7XGC3_9FUNG|nr:hypothetical protein LPJ64_006126 [Coemansia asiatica]KAJ2849483.1 hypothetical protein J3B02_003788 [Coemansia erecta]KAJ2879471.1 hypothetical protein FB639_003079 [Coemansia asiatica]
MSAANTNAERHSRAALMDIYKAERSWDGWNSDGLAIANDLINLVLQAHNSQEPSVWHPSILPQFPDLADRYLEATLAEAYKKLEQLEHKISMMSRQIERMQAAGESLLKILPPKNSTAADTFRQPFATGTLQWYADLTFRACKVYREAVDMRVTHIDELRASIIVLGSVDRLGNRLDSEEQMAKLSCWLHSPGLKNAFLLDSKSSSLMLSDFDDLLKAELCIEEI